VVYAFLYLSEYCICVTRVPENGEMGALLLSSSPRTRILWLISSVSLLLKPSSRYWLEETVDKNSLNRSRLSLIESIRPCPALVRQKRRERWMKKKIRWLKLRMMTNAYLKKVNKYFEHYYIFCQDLLHLFKKIEEQFKKCIFW